MAKKDDITKQIVVAGVVAVGSYYIYNAFVKKTPPAAANTTGAKPAGTVPPVRTNIPTTTIAPSYAYPIVYNKFHPDVKMLQAALGVSEDGIIGPQTLTALKAYGPFTTNLSFGNFSALYNTVDLIYKGGSYATNLDGETIIVGQEQEEYQDNDDYGNGYGSGYDDYYEQYYPEDFY